MILGRKEKRGGNPPSCGPSHNKRPVWGGGLALSRPGFGDISITGPAKRAHANAVILGRRFYVHCKITFEMIETIKVHVYVEK